MVCHAYLRVRSLEMIPFSLQRRMRYTADTIVWWRGVPSADVGGSCPAEPPIGLEPAAASIATNGRTESDTWFFVGHRLSRMSGVQAQSAGRHPPRQDARTATTSTAGSLQDEGLGRVKKVDS
jgi:hypothetical protein